MNPLILMSTAALITTQPATQEDARDLAQTGAALIACVVAAQAADEDPETEITISADRVTSAYSQAETLIRQADAFVRENQPESETRADPVTEFIVSHSPDFSTGFYMGQAERRALIAINQEAMEQLDRDTDGVYDGFLDSRVWSGFRSYWDNECEAKFAELAAE